VGAVWATEAKANRRSAKRRRSFIVKSRFYAMRQFANRYT
jgi:hypothetical protein